MGKGLVNWWWTWVYEMLNQEGWQLDELVVSFLRFLGYFLNQWELSSAFTVLLKDVPKNRWLNEVLSRFEVSPKLSGSSYIYIYIISLKYRFITCGCLGKEDFPLFPTSSHLFPASITSVSLFQFFDRVIENILVSHLTCFQLVLPFLSVCPLCLRSCGCLGTKKCFCSRTSFPSCPLLVTKGSSWSILGIWVWVYGLLELQRSNVNS